MKATKYGCDINFKDLFIILTKSPENKKGTLFHAYSPLKMNFLRRRFKFFFPGL